MLDLVAIFKAVADDAGFGFAYGRADIINYEVTTNVDLDSGESVILVDPIEETAVISNSVINQWNCRTSIALGKKFDADNSTGTFSSLDETEKQKWDRRLKDMRDTLVIYLKNVFCAYDLELKTCFLLREINKFDENLDIIAANITFTYDHDNTADYVYPEPD